MFGRRQGDNTRPSDDRPRPADDAARPEDGGGSDAAEGTRDPDETQGLIDSLTAERDDLKDKWLRAMAEYQNYQRRAIANEHEARRQAVTSVLGSILPVLDSFDMALSAGPKDAAGSAMHEGMRAVQQALVTALGQHGVGLIKPVPNDAFDPNQHSAILQQAIEGVEPGRVSMCLQVGYSLGDRVARSAKVAVAPGTARDGEPAQGN